MAKTTAPRPPAGRELTLTRGEIAFLNATIELMREDQANQFETVTIPVTEGSLFAKALIKTAKYVNKWVQKNGGWVALATAATDLFGFTARSSTLTSEQVQEIKSLRNLAERGFSLDELIALRDSLERGRIGVQQAVRPKE